MTEFMRHSDAFTWAMEHDPRLRSTVVTILRFDRSPDWDELVSRFDRVARTLPMFRRRVVDNLPPAPPSWEDDAEFDLGYHLRRVTAPPPSTFETVLEMARLAEMADFDRARPLWEVTLVEGLENGEAAVLVKLHHALTDGVGGVEIAMILFDLEQQAADRGPMPPDPVIVVRPPWSELRQLVRYDAGLVADLARAAVRTGPTTLLHGLRRPVDSARAAAELAASVYRTVRPINQTGSPLMRERGLGRRLGVHRVPLAELRAAARGSDGTLNDAFLAAITGGLRLYHEKHGVEIGELHVNMPVNIRADGDPVGGNRITLMRFDLPIDVADPADRIRGVHDRANGIRSEASLPYTQQIAGALNLAPRWYIASILRHVDFLASNVPGIPVPVYLGGAALTMQYPFGPTIGAAVNVTLMTYVDTCAIGINADTTAIPDFDLFHECLVAGFDEVLGL
ncbi:wax ester/triacylglycerol synthase domain-containing protein [Nocardioides ferulae]|uniref:wax ester/triacylglycerol synthase domain-containing protein n=1 Tax=Nocardioides ferulae TaxID=2340821 RepID=UPI000EB4DC12|nr:wax ester/triacylglycerol synthase domain-containing protein [Nocardioides ferulae]